MRLELICVDKTLLAELALKGLLSAVSRHLVRLEVTLKMRKLQILLPYKWQHSLFGKFNFYCAFQ